MSIEIVTNWQTLIRLAGELGQARLSGDGDRIKQAEKAHQDYVEVCLKADRMVGLELDF